MLGRYTTSPGSRAILARPCIQHFSPPAGCGHPLAGRRHDRAWPSPQTLGAARAHYDSVSPGDVLPVAPVIARSAIQVGVWLQDESRIGTQGIAGRSVLVVVVGGDEHNALVA